MFVIEELYPGYGVTLGNALRRVLYSSLQGAAITKVKIKGAPHEFSTLPGVLEDILEITLNLKQVYVKLHSDEPQTATIKAKGVKEVTAADIVSPSQVEIANPGAHIASLTRKDAQFEAELTIEPGLGYLAVEKRPKERTEIGAIPLDAIFTPMVKVNFEVENMRVGDRTDYNRLVVEIITNGTISPQNALMHAAKLLDDHFRIILELGEQKEVKEAAPKAAKTKKAKTTSPKAKRGGKKK